MTTTFSKLVLFETTIRSPGEAASTAAWIVGLSAGTSIVAAPAGAAVMARAARAVESAALLALRTVIGPSSGSRFPAW